MVNKVTDKEAVAQIQKWRPEVLEYAIVEYNQDNWIKEANMAFTMGPNADKLMSCMETAQGKASVKYSLAIAARTGLSLNPHIGEACLVPYWTWFDKKKTSGGFTCNYQVMKAGLIRLAMESGKVTKIICDVKRTADDLTIKKTTAGDTFEFVPAVSNRGDIDCFFAAALLDDGQSHVCVMDLHEMNEHRDKYATVGRDKDTGKIANWAPSIKSFVGWGMKTVIRRLLNNLHISEGVTAAVQADNESEAKLIDITPEPDRLPEKGTNADDVREKMKPPPKAANQDTVAGSSGQAPVGPNTATDAKGERLF